MTSIPTPEAGHRTIAASAAIGAPIASVFAFLADPANHRRLAGRRVRLLELAGGDELVGGAMMLHGPLLIRRRVETQVSSMHEPHVIGGVAWLGPRSRVAIRWKLDQQSADSTEVVLTADPCSLSRADRLILRLGGARWIRTMFAETIERLAAHLTPTSTPQTPPTPQTPTLTPVPVPA